MIQIQLIIQRLILMKGLLFYSLIAQMHIFPGSKGSLGYVSFTFRAIKNSIVMVSISFCLMTEKCIETVCHILYK